MNYEKLLLDIIQPIVDDKENVSVKQMDSLDENEVLLYVYANDNDIARLIGRKGAMAGSIRQMISIASLEAHKRITIKFESF